MEGSVRRVKVQHSNRTRRVYEGVLNACAHRIAYWFDITGVRGFDEEMGERLDEEAEDRARTCIAQDYREGELNALYVFDSGRETEVRGWWAVQA